MEIGALLLKILTIKSIMIEMVGTGSLASGALAFGTAEKITENIAEDIVSSEMEGAFLKASGAAVAVVGIIAGAALTAKAISGFPAASIKSSMAELIIQFSFFLIT